MQRDHAPADADGTFAAAATRSDAISSSRVRRSLPAADVDDLVGTRRRVQMQLGGAHSGMARSAAVASRTADEVEAQRKRRREQKNACDRKRRKAAAEEADAASEAAGEGEGESSGEGEGESEGVSEAEYAWVPPSKALREEARARWRSAYRRGRKAGRRIFHRERAEWYERATGERLEGSAAEQHARFHDVTRRYRAYTDR